MISLRRLRAIGCVAAAFLAGGCESSDLSGKTDITREVLICLPPDTPAPSVIVRAVWFPNAMGAGSADSFPMHVTGVLVLAGDRLWFMSWNEPEKHYDMLHVIAFQLAQRVAVSRMGPSSVLVLQSGNDTYDSFELMNGGQFGSDPATTQDLCDRIQRLRANAPQSDR
ncbi:MAG TPA: hypothetical protein VII43_03385 [Opitutaceae bacterium]